MTTFMYGMVVVSNADVHHTYARLLGLLPRSQWQRILATLRTLGFALYDTRMEVEHGLLDGLREFQAHLGGRLTIMLLWDIGQGLEVHEVDPDLVRESLALLKKRPHPLPGLRPGWPPEAWSPNFEGRAGGYTDKKRPWPL